MPGPEFHTTPRGARFFDVTMPRIADELATLNNNLSALLVVNDRVDALLERVHHVGDVRDVAAHEPIPGIGRDVGQVLGITGVSQSVEVDDLEVRIRGEEQLDVVRADEAGSACDEEFHVVMRLLLEERRRRERI